MQRRAALVLFSLCFPLPLWAPQLDTRWSVALAAVGSRQQTVELSSTLLSKVQGKLESHGRVEIVGQRLSGLRSEVSNEQIIDYGAEIQADATAILQFEPVGSETEGFVYIWTARTRDGKTRPAVFAEPIDLANVQDWQVSLLAATIVQTASSGMEVSVELHVYTKPPGAFFTVGNSDPEKTDLPGRTKDEGYKPWGGTRPEGPTDIEIYKPPDYAPVTTTIEVKRLAGRKRYRQTIEVELKKKPNKQKDSQ